MDAQKIGMFIAHRRKVMGLTQAELAEKLHVTDKAISRWERGIGLPDINILEPLAQTLDVNLIELAQAKTTTDETISIQEVETIVSDTIQLYSKNETPRMIGSAILGLFGIITLLLFSLLIADGSIVAYSVGSIVTGLIAWASPIWHMTLTHSRNTVVPGLISFGSALTSLTIQFFQLAQNVATGDFAAIEDTIHALCTVVILFSLITLCLNLLMIWRSKKR